MIKARKMGLVLALLLTISLSLHPAPAIADSPTVFSGYLWEVSGASTNKHFTARYAWLSMDGLELYVAFQERHPHEALNKDVVNLSYGGVNLFTGPNKPEAGRDYWKLIDTILTVDGVEYPASSDRDNWLVVRYGPQTPTNPMTVGVKMRQNGFSIISMKVPLPLHTVTYDSNGGTGVLSDSAKYVPGQQVTALTNNNAFAKAGHSFAGWNTNTDGSGEFRGEGDIFTMPNDDVVLYAQWTEVTPETITIAAVDKTKVYGDDDPELTFVITDGADLVSPEDFTGSLTRVIGEDVGCYEIQQGSLALSDNYTLTFVAGEFEITPRTITVIADDKSKVYGSDDPALSYQVTTGELVEGDEFSGAIMRVAGKDVGVYAIHQGTLALSDNYTLTFVAGEFEITPRTITVIADDKSKVYGSDDPGLSYQVTAGELVEGDEFSGAIMRVAGEDVGVYAIQQGSLALSDNYILTFVAGELEITPSLLPVTGGNEYRYYFLGLLAMLFGALAAVKARRLTN